MTSAQHSDQHVALYNQLGQLYEDVYGSNPGQIAFIQKCLSLLTTRTDCPDPVILEMGVGTGKPTATMAAAAGIAIDGYDLSATMLELARRNVPAGNFTLDSHMEFAPPEGRAAAGGGFYDGVFAIFTTPDLTKEEMKVLFEERLGRWVKKGGYLFFGNFSLAAYLERFPGGEEVSERDEESAKVATKFFGERAHPLVWTEKGWGELLRLGGFEMVEQTVVPFQADADCDWEPHEFTIARKV